MYQKELVCANLIWSDLVLVKKYEDDYTELLKHLPQRPTIADAFIDFAKRHKFSFWQEDED